MRLYRKCSGHYTLTMCPNRSHCPTLLNSPQSSTHTTLCNISGSPHLQHQNLTPLNSVRTPNMLASRLVLNLRIYKVPSDPVLMSDPDSPSRVISEIRFPPESNAHQKDPGQCRVSGNTGAPPDHAQWQSNPCTDSVEGCRTSDGCHGSRLVSMFYSS